MGFFDNNRLIDLLSNYLKTQFELVKLDIQERIEELLTRIFTFFLTAFAVLITLFFALMGLANFLNDWLKSAYIGYLIVAGFSTIVSLILLSNLKKQEKKEVEEDDTPATEEEIES
ncbi:phage holin family protein [Aquirufa aurantiipilula]|uniref:Phage holin family protein n=1 Tax=Aquirufa aurantiipilula TaxID=2696561 RepID=A0ABT6BGJ3_9BACT|nr:phage holin family protein [Aquirufa aurantiipilula]MDF5689544.1 phage holin family protein [Aquirufa aurantiipilula]